MPLVSICNEKVEGAIVNGGTPKSCCCIEWYWPSKDVVGLEYYFLMRILRGVLFY